MKKPEPLSEVLRRPRPASSQPYVEAVYRRIGRLMREVRVCRGLTQAKLGEALGVEGAHISNIERGFRRVDLHALPTIARALDIRLDELLSVVFQLGGKP